MRVWKKRIGGAASEREWQQTPEMRPVVMSPVRQGSPINCEYKWSTNARDRSLTRALPRACPREGQDS